MPDLSQYSIIKIKTLLSRADNDSLVPLLEKAESDSRSGVKKLAKTFRVKIKKDKALRDKAEAMTKLERELYRSGYGYVAGTDEVGRGCLAGPIVAAAVIFEEETVMVGVKDSKKLTAAQREHQDKEIKKRAIAWSIALIDNNVIDELGIQQANLDVLYQAVNRLKPQPEFVLVDGFSLPLCSLPQRKLIKGDSRSLSVAAASILAKVYRDSLMEDISGNYAAYGFERNKGYGTAEHLQAIEKYGYTPIHRKSFAPVSKSWQKQLF